MSQERNILSDEDAGLMNDARLHELCFNWYECSFRILFPDEKETSRERRRGRKSTKTVITRVCLSIHGIYEREGL